MKGVTGKRSIAILTAAVLMLGALLGSTAAQAEGPGITPDPTSGPVNTPISVSGTGFAGTSTITVLFGDAEAATTTSNELGEFTATITANASAGYGAITISASDGVTSSSATFTLAGPPSILVSPTSGVVNTLITVTGADFAATSTITLTYNGAPVSMALETITTDATGAFSASFNAPTAPLGEVTVTATDAEGASDSAIFTLDGPPAIGLAPITGVVNTPITVTGTKFAAGATVTLSYGGAPVATDPVVVTANAAGGFTATFNAPVAAFGDVTVAAAASIGDGDSATFTLDGPPTIALVPTSGFAGDEVSVTGAKFAANSTVSITFDGSPVTTTPETVTTGDDGGFVATFVVPEPGVAALENKAVVASDSHGQSAGGSFYFLDPKITLSPTTGVVNTPIAVTGTGFSAESPITLTYDGDIVGMTMSVILTDPDGAFTASFNAPLAAAYGVVTVSATDAEGVSATAPFELIGPPAITLSTTEGLVGDEFTITGEKFAATSTVALLFGAHSLGSATTDGAGNFSATVQVPAPLDASEYGANPVKATDEAGQSATADYFLAAAKNVNDAPVTYYASIQAAINAASTSTPDTVVVGPGVHPESININRALVLSARDGSGATTIRGAVTDTPTVKITANNVTLGNGGFTLVNGTGSSMPPLVSVDWGVSGTTIQNNILDASNNHTGILVGGNALTSTTASLSILRNKITGAAHVAAISVQDGKTAVTIQNNFINGNIKALVLGNGVLAKVQNNDLSGNTSGIVFSTPIPVAADAGGNWWGVNSDVAIAALMGGLPFVDFTPFLDAGTDIDPGVGFQGDFSTLHVSALGAQTPPTGRVQEGVNRVTASTVIVHGGVYNEAVVINKSVTLESTGGAGVTIITSGGLAVPATISVNNAADVTIGGAAPFGGFTVKGSSIGVLATSAPGLIVQGNVINPVGANGRGVDATGSPGTVVFGGEINIGGDGTSLGVALRTSGQSLVSAVTMSISGSATGTAVVLNSSPESEVEGVAAVVSSPQKSYGVRVNSSPASHVSNSHLTVLAGTEGVGVLIGQSGGSFVHNNSISVDAGGNATGISVVDSPGTVVKDNPGVGTLHITPAEGIAAHSVNGSARGISVVRSPDSVVADSFFDVFTELSVGEGVFAGESSGISLSGLNVKVSGGAGARGLVVMGSGGTMAVDSFFDVFTELSVAEGVVVGNSPGVTLGGLGLSDTPVRVSGGNGARGVSINGSEGASLADSFFDVFTEFSGIGVFAQGDPDFDLLRVNVKVVAGGQATGLIADGDPDFDLLDSFFDVFTELSVGEGAIVGKSPNASLSGLDVRVKGGVGARGLSVSESGGAQVIDSFFDVFTELSFSGATLFKSPNSTLSGTRVRLWGGSGIGLDVNESPDSSAIGSFFDIFTELSVTGAVIGASPRASIESTGFDIASNENAVGLRVLDSPGA
ncbi:MAG: hypothetical protein HY681_04030, partial [Chloroflexi bacterium]|nr:hypothetical protein [Chloroflexota bacterium]